MMENTRSLSNLLTIVIPSKNEGRILYDCIYNISKQSNISGTKIIIADVSDDEKSLWFLWKLQFVLVIITISDIALNYFVCTQTQNDQIPSE